LKVQLKKVNSVSGINYTLLKNHQETIRKDFSTGMYTTQE